MSHRTILVRALTVLILAFTPAARAAEYWLADQQAFPGAIWHAGDNRPEALQHRRAAKADAAFPRAIMKVGQVAAAPDDGFFFCSGLDGYVLGLLDGQFEVLTFDVDGQVRDVACGGEDHVVYFSVVETPQETAPLADGKIYRRDLWEGQATEVATVRQVDVGGNWWGTFCVREGVIYLATTEPTSRLFRLTSAAPEPIYPSNTRRILGFDADSEGFVIADGTGEIVRTADFTTFQPVLTSAVKASDVAIRRAR